MSMQAMVEISARASNSQIQPQTMHPMERERARAIPKLNVKRIIPQKRFVTEYMQKPPHIMPNYGKKKPLQQLSVPKTSMTRVLLYDNITQQQMLDVKLAHIKIEKQRVAKLMELHKRSFRARMNKRHQQMQDAGNRLDTQLPVISRTVPSSRYTGRLSKFSFKLDDISLPKLEQNKKYVLFKLKEKSGSHKVYHTEDNDGIFVDFVPLHTFYRSVVEDPRFQSLEEVLSRSESDLNSAGFAKLSPSYMTMYQSFFDRGNSGEKKKSGDDET